MKNKFNISFDALKPLFLAFMFTVVATFVMLTLSDATLDSATDVH